MIFQSNGRQVEKQGRTEIQKFEYREREKSFLDEIKSIFHGFWRAIIWWKNKNLMKIADTSFKFYINLLMEICENFHVKGIFHHHKSNRIKVYRCIYLVSMFFRFVKLYSARNQCIYFQVILFLFISNSEYIGRSK